MIAELVADLDHAHQTGVHAQEIELSSQLLANSREHFLQLDIVEKIFRVVVVGNRARRQRAGDRWPKQRAMKFRPTDYANPPNRDRFTFRPVARIFAASDDVQPEIVSRRVIDVLVVPTIAVVPDNEQVALRGIIFDPPLREIDEHGWIAGIGFAEIFDRVFFQRLLFCEQVTACLRAGGLSVELRHDVEVVG